MSEGLKPYYFGEEFSLCFKTASEMCLSYVHVSSRSFKRETLITWLCLHRNLSNDPKVLL